MRSVERALGWLVKANLGLAALALVAMMLQVGVDVVMRELFEEPLSGTLEIVSYWYMTGIVFLAIPVAQANRDHIQVELFTAMMLPRRRDLLDAAVLLACVALLVLFAWVAGEEAWRETLKGGRVEAGVGTIVVWPTRWLVPVSMGLTAMISLLQAMNLILRGSHGTLDHRAGGARADV